MRKNQQIILLMRVLAEARRHKTTGCGLVIAICQKYGYKPATVQTAIRWLQKNRVLRPQGQGVLI